jgi:hypothetical protein
VVGFCEHANEPWGFGNCVAFLRLPNEPLASREDSSLWSYSSCQFGRDRMPFIPT